MEPIHWWLIAWCLGALATHLYGWRCGRLELPTRYGEIEIIVWFLIWPIGLVLLVGAHVRRGRKFRKGVDVP